MAKRRYKVILLVMILILVSVERLSFVEPLYIPVPPVEILNANGTIYMWYEGGEIVKYEKGLIKRSSKEVR